MPDPQSLPRPSDGTAPVAHRDLSHLAGLSEFETGLMIAMPCCAFMMGADMEDAVPGEWSRVYEPPRWTCPQCEKTYSVGTLGFLEEVGSDAF